jgi:lipoprotein-anchoring transpeptidase ErfK/SrfK
VDLRTTRHRIEVRLGERMLRAYDGDQELVSTKVVVGAPSTPTPTGVFYVTDEVPQRNPAGAYGPVALATDGYSEAMDYFSTGVPVIALHGTSRPELVGQAVANGCVRVPNDLIQQLADTIDPGTPVLIWP